MMGEIWDPRWRELAEMEFEPGTMRRNAKLMEHIQTGANHLPYWSEKCRKSGVPPTWMEDSKFGDPEGAEIGGRFVTAHSCRMAYYAHRILPKWSLGEEEKCTVVEIGPGFGSLARLIAKLLGDGAR